MFHLMYCPLRFCTTDVVLVRSFISVPVSADMETYNDLSMHNNETHLILFQYVLLIIAQFLLQLSGAFFTICVTFYCCLLLQVITYWQGP